MEQYATTIRKLEEQRTSLNANLTHERAKNQRLAEALKQWREWAGRHQANLYHGDLTDDGYEALGELVAETNAALRGTGIDREDETT